METKDLDRIEKYLSGKMVPEENKLFEKELRESKDLADQTKKVAYIIHSVNVVGLKRDNERIIHSDSIFSDICNQIVSFTIGDEVEVRTILALKVLESAGVALSTLHSFS